MSKFYQRKDNATGSLIGEAAPLPPELTGLGDDALADLSWADPVLGYKGQGFFLVDEPLDQLKKRAYAAALLQYETRFLAGFPLTIQGNAETLQMRPADLINWLVFKDSCQDAIDAGFGDELNPQAIRTTDNSEYNVTSNAGKLTMIAMRLYGALLMRNHWTLKDQIRDAANRDALEAVDVSDGWPVSTYNV